MDKKISIAGSIPLCFQKLYDLKLAIDEAEKMLEAMYAVQDDSIQDAILLLEEKTNEMEDEQEKFLKEAEPYFEALMEINRRACICAKLHYENGLTWEKISEQLGQSDDAIKHAVHRACAKLQKQQK